jgi:hypothetical protein
VTDWYLCVACHKLTPIIDGDKDAKCLTCGGTNGQIVSQQHFDEGYKAGAYYDIDPRTGGRAKKKKKRK